MGYPIMRSPASERGMALMSALLLLLVTTILGIAMFRSFGLLERIAGNTREKQRALHSADSAQTYAEWWLTSNSGINATTGASCATPIVVTPTVCSNVLTNPATLPWGTGGVSYNPANTMQVGTAGTAGDYVSLPVFYISFLSTAYNPSSGTTTNTYQIDAAGYAGSTNSAAVVEDVYNVGVTYTSQDSLTKFQNLGGP
jgi:type IV pilus assembly protein PilX